MQTINFEIEYYTSDYESTGVFRRVRTDIETAREIARNDMIKYGFDHAIAEFRGMATGRKRVFIIER